MIHFNRLEPSVEGTAEQRRRECLRHECKVTWQQAVLESLELASATNYAILYKFPVQFMSKTGKRTPQLTYKIITVAIEL